MQSRDIAEVSETFLPLNTALTFEYFSELFVKSGQNAWFKHEHCSLLGLGNQQNIFRSQHMLIFFFKFIHTKPTFLKVAQFERN